MGDAADMLRENEEDAELEHLMGRCEEGCFYCRLIHSQILRAPASPDEMEAYED
jgi:hypothetical protein